MANKKNTSKKSTNTKKKATTAKKEVVKEEVLPKKTRKDSHEENLKKIESLNGSGMDSLHVVRVAAIIIIVFCLFYFLTLYLTNRDSSSSSSSTPRETTISYSTIMAGRSFSMTDEEYLIVYYDSTDTENSSSISSGVSAYKVSEGALPTYTVDLHDAINQSYVKEESNTQPSNISELSINGPTLIHFVNGSVSEYIEGVESITDYLK